MRTVLILRLIRITTLVSGDARGRSLDDLWTTGFPDNAARPPAAPAQRSLLAPTLMPEPDSTGSPNF